MSSVTLNTAEMQRRQGIMMVAVPLVGVAVALLVVALMIRYLLNGDNTLVVSMVVPLGVSALVSLAVALLLYWLGLFYSPSIRLTFFFTTLIISALTVANGLVAANLMFVDRIIVYDTTILLVFTTLIATAFGFSGYGRATAALKQMTLQARQVADGDLAARVAVNGRDELAQLGSAFNEMAEKLAHAAREREELERMRRDLIAWVSHDLRTPLTSIRAMVEALNDGVVTDTVAVDRYYRTILSDVLGLNRLIDDLFELAQLDAGGLAFETEQNSLSDLISDTLESFRALAGRHNVALDGQIDANVGLVRINAEKISRVLYNLISNALKYTPAEGAIKVAARRHGSEVWVTVQDSGAGFNAADLPHVFEKFYRGEGARSRLHGSSAGLGLAIARGIVEAHGGRIWAENAPQGGAAVTFTLPN